jgi:hypothetical protein
MAGYGLCLSLSLIITAGILASGFGPWFWTIAIPGVFGAGLFSWRLLKLGRRSN